MRNKRPVNKNKGKINFHNKGKLTTKAEVADKVNNIQIVGMRLNKYVAHCGVCSRREASLIISEGKIKVNGQVAKEAFYQIKAGDKVEYAGKVIAPARELVYLLMNKPKNIHLADTAKEKGRATVMELIGSDASENVMPVGILERDTLGLLIMTNDDELSQKLNNSKRKVKNIYKVTLTKRLLKKHLEAIAKSPELENETIVVKKIEWSEDSPGKKEAQIEIHSGSDAAVAKIFEHFGYEVEKLDRIYYGGLTKKDLPRGQFRFLSEREVIMLKHFS